MFNENRLNWPVNGDINAWADYVETLCILTTDGVLSIDDFADRLIDDPAKTMEDVLRAINFNEHFLGPLRVIPNIIVPSPPGLREMDIDEESDDDEFNGEDAINVEREAVQSRLITLFNFINARKGYFADYYPFNVSNQDLTVSIVPIAQQSRMHKMYQVLLFSSEMQLYNRGDINRLGHMFEALCKRPFAQLLPAIAEKKFFGAGAGDILPRDYEGNLREKLKLLAVDISCLTKAIIDDPDEISPTGDAGLDWVGWVSLEDNCNHQPLYFGQCACGANWVDKQHETALSNWFNYLDINQSLQCFHFMPRSFRRNSLGWFRETDIVYQLTLIDRYRMLKVIDLESDRVIDEMLAPFANILRVANEFELE